MKRLRPLLACLCTFGALFSTNVRAEAAALSHVPDPGQRFQDALKAADLEREMALNVRSDSAPGAKKAGAQAKGTPGTTTTIFGNIINNQGSPLCGLVLANGQFMFSCSPNGTFSLSNVPFDSNGVITLFGFVDGHFPFKAQYVTGGRADMMLYIASGSGGPPPSETVITFNITDSCNNGIPISYKFYDETNGLVWPSSTTHYETSQYGATYTNNLQCIVGAKVCYGARSASFFWGVDVDNSQGCSDCCMFCQTGNTLSRALSC